MNTRISGWHIIVDGKPMPRVTSGTFLSNYDQKIALYYGWVRFISLRVKGKKKKEVFGKIEFIDKKGNLISGREKLRFHLTEETKPREAR
jgi:hypothetical protein